MTVAVVCDGGVSLPADPPPGITVIPLQVAESPTRQGANGAPGRTTAAPSPGAFLEAIGSADQGDGVLVLTVASRLSSASAAARLAVGLAEQDGLRAALVDSASATVGEGLVATAAQRCAARGGSLLEVATRAEEVAARVRLVAAISSLDELVRSGRVPGIAATATRVSGLRPLFELVDGAVRPRRPAMGVERAERRLVAELSRSYRPAHVLHVGVLHGAEPGSAARLCAAAAEIAPLAEEFVAELSPLMLLHTGPGVSGLAWWWEQADRATAAP